MSNDSDLLTAISHLVLCSVSVHGVTHYSHGTWVHPGMHVNYFVHGIIGFMKYTKLGNVEQAYKISLTAAKYLGLPCLMADLYSSSRMGDMGKALTAAHLVSGIVPLILEVQEKPNKELCNTILLFNVISCCYFAVTKDRKWCYYLAASAIFTFFVAPTVHESVQAAFAIGLSLMDHCAYHVFVIDTSPVGPR